MSSRVISSTSRAASRVAVLGRSTSRIAARYPLPPRPHAVVHAVAIAKTRRRTEAPSISPLPPPPPHRMTVLHGCCTACARHFASLSHTCAVVRLPRCSTTYAYGNSTSVPAHDDDVDVHGIVGAVCAARSAGSCTTNHGHSPASCHHNAAMARTRYTLVLPCTACVSRQGR